MRTLLVDNYDSYSNNLAELIARVSGIDPIIVMNDRLAPDQVAKLPVDCIVLSPGPGAPENPRDIGISEYLIDSSALPILGVCLGHQTIAHRAGSGVSRAAHPGHGLLSTVLLTDDPLFNAMPPEIRVVRYHSLAVTRPLPSNLIEIGTDTDGTIMAVRRVGRPQWGVQFHPEAACTELGEQLIKNFQAIVMSGRPKVAGRARQQSVKTARKSATPPSQILHLAHRQVECQAPASAVFAALFAKQAASFWLDTNTQRLSHGWSFMGAPESALDHVLTADGNTVVKTTVSGHRSEQQVVSLWRHLNDELLSYQVVGSIDSPFKGGYLGFLAYGLATDLTGAAHSDSDLPEVALQFCTHWVCFDHVSNRVFACVATLERESVQGEHWLEKTAQIIEALPAPARSRVTSPRVDAEDVAVLLAQSALDTREEYENKVRTCIEKIKEGESYEICLTTGFQGSALQDPLGVYQVLRSVNPAPYSAYLDFSNFQILSSSPERFLRITEGGLAESKPIKGTRPREEDPHADVLAAAELAADPKMRAENMMIVDLVRNDLNRVCAVGTVNVDSLMHVESYQTVHQLVSTISGRLAEGRTSLHAVEACFPGGSMTGAPKRRTMDIISELEPHARGAYAGTLGLLSLDGYIDLSIVIRTIVNTSRRWFVGAGGAVLINSNPAEEYCEMLQKASPPLRAVALASRNGATRGGQV